MSEVNLVALLSEVEEMLDTLELVKKFCKRQDVLAVAIMIDRAKENPNTAEETKIGNLPTAISRCKINLETYENSVSRLKRKLEREQEAKATKKGE